MMNINMSSSLSESLEKQGIVTILGSDYSTEKTKLAQVTSLRRTLSADMSSKKWLTQHGFSPMKKIASSKELSLSLVDDNHSNHEDGYEYEQNMNKEDYEKPGQFDIWSSIISQNKANNNIQEPPPYIHPLVKRSSSSLSEKSLEICTESLGSETGADVFSSLQASVEIGDVEFEKEEEEEEEKVSQLNLVANCVDQDHEYCTTRDVKYNCFSRNLPPKSFPPPLPILSQSDGASLNMKKHRDNGRLVLQAESVPLQKNFSATRQKGRLVLTVVSTNLDPIDINHEKIVEKIIKLDHDGEFEEEVGERDEKEEEIEEEEEEAVYTEVLKKNKSMEIDIVGIEQGPKMSSTTRVTSVHRLALMVNKPIGLANRLNKFNEVVTYGRMEGDVVIKSAPRPKSLPPRPPVARSISLIPVVPKEAATATSFNAYEYSWRAKPKHYIKEKSNKLSVFTDDKIITKNNQQQQQQMVVLRGNKAEYVVPLIKGCKEPRRSLVFWEPFCVATS